MKTDECSLMRRRCAGRPALHRPPAGRRGFTLAEALLASAILAMAVAAVSNATTASLRQNQVLQQRMMQLSLARQLMDEIASKPFLNPLTGQVGTGHPDKFSRWLYTCIGDYHGYTDSSADMRNLAGQSLPSTKVVCERSVSVEYRDRPDGSAVAGGDFALVTVTVTAPSCPPLTIKRLLTRVRDAG